MRKIEIIFIILVKFTQTWALLTFPSLTIHHYMINPYFLLENSKSFQAHSIRILYFAYLTSVFLAVISHIRIILSNPGWTPSLPSPINSELSDYCKNCDQYKPRRSHHCKTCQKCVHRLDHHCLWAGNCIGNTNKKFFILFLFYTTCVCIIGLLILLISSTSQKVREKVDNFAIFCIFFILLELFVFCSFGGVLLLVEIRSIRNNQTTIEFYQKKKGQTLSLVENFESVFGRNSWAWLLPVNANFTIDYYEEMIDMTR